MIRWYCDSDQKQCRAQVQGEQDVPGRQYYSDLQECRQKCAASMSQESKASSTTNLSSTFENNVSLESNTSNNSTTSSTMPNEGTIVFLDIDSSRPTMWERYGWNAVNKALDDLRAWVNDYSKPFQVYTIQAFRDGYLLVFTESDSLFRACSFAKYIQNLLVLSPIYLSTSNNSNNVNMRLKVNIGIAQGPLQVDPNTQEYMGNTVQNALEAHRNPTTDGFTLAVDRQENQPWFIQSIVDMLPESWGFDQVTCRRTNSNPSATITTSSSSQPPMQSNSCTTTIMYAVNQPITS